MSRYSWPGNVRELDNAIQRALILQEGPLVTAEGLGLGDPRPEGPCPGAEMESGAAPAERALQRALEESAGVLGNDLKRRAFEIILRTLREENGRRKETAEKLGVSARTLRYKLARMRDFGINIESLVQV